MSACPFSANDIVDRPIPSFHEHLWSNHLYQSGRGIFRKIRYKRYAFQRRDNRQTIFQGIDGAVFSFAKALCRCIIVKRNNQ